jgi:hypothetical protein
MMTMNGAPVRTVNNAPAAHPIGDQTVAQRVLDVLASPGPSPTAPLPVGEGGPAGSVPAKIRDLKLDFLQFQLGKLPQLDMPLTHRFTPGLYCREIVMPKCAIVISRVHKFEHPFVVSQGSVAVWCENDGWQLIEAPHTGITKPGTRRILFIIEECRWTTFHTGPWAPDTDPEQIVAEVTDTPDVGYIERLEAEIRKTLEDVPRSGEVGEEERILV